VKSQDAIGGKVRVFIIRHRRTVRNFCKLLVLPIDFFAIHLTPPHRYMFSISPETKKRHHLPNLEDGASF
jgi:hypothetical protein